MVKHIYQDYFKQFKVFRTLAVLWKRMQYLKNADRRPPSWCLTDSEKKELDNICMAVVCDEMTWLTLQGVCNLVYLTPDNWRERLEFHKPDVFFCESAWSGTKEHGCCWEDKIAHRQNIWGENRLVLKDILTYCHNAGIPTVFWNKEDPHSDNEEYSFTDTAHLFDHICTTAKECIQLYRARGHKSVHLLPFGFSPKLFYPIEEPGEENTAAFFGSWYQQFPERCEATARLFDFVLSQGMKLTIYDRNSKSNDPNKVFPVRYQSYVRDAVPYTEVRNELKKYQYVLNLNTETQSNTMFARRVFEAMACGRMIISNESRGMRNLFPGRIWFINEDFDKEKEPEAVAKNLQTVRENYTFEKQFLGALCAAGVIQIN